MATILPFPFTTGQNLYAVLQNEAGNVWNGTTFTAFVQGNWTDYDVALAESSTSGRYQFTFPAAITTAGTYYSTIYHRASGTPAVTDTPVGEGEIVWSGTALYVAGTVTQAASSVASAVSGSTITLERGDTLSAALTGIGTLTGRSKLWFTVKKQRSSADTASLIQIEETAGLLYINGAAGTAGNGSITVTDASTGALTVALVASQTSGLARGQYVYDIQKLVGTTVTTMAKGNFHIVDDVTRATS